MAHCGGNDGQWLSEEMDKAGCGPRTAWKVLSKGSI